MRLVMIGIFDPPLIRAHSSTLHAVVILARNHTSAGTRIMLETHRMANLVAERLAALRVVIQEIDVDAKVTLITPIVRRDELHALIRMPIRTVARVRCTLAFGF